MSLPVTTDATLEEVSTSAPVVLVKLTAEYCAPCKMFNPVLEQFNEETGVPVYNLDIEENTEASKLYRIGSIPALLVFTDGRFREALIGAKSLASLKRDLAGYLTTAE